MSSALTFQIKLPEKGNINKIRSKLTNLKKKGLSIEILHDENNVLSAKIEYPNKLAELETELSDMQRKRSKAKDEILFRTYDDLVKSIEAEIGALEGGIEISIIKDRTIKILKNFKQDKHVDVDIFKHYLDIYFEETITNLFGGTS